MNSPLPYVAPERLIEAILTGSGPDRALDALIMAAAKKEVKGRELFRRPVVSIEQARVAPPFTADFCAIRSAAQAHGIVLASGLNQAGAWASAWLPPQHGLSPILMFASDEPRAGCAALIEALNLIRRQGQVRAANLV